MRKSKRDSRGFTLIAALLLTLLLSGVAVGLLYLVTSEQRMGNNDLEGNLAFYGAESGMENLTAQLSQLYQTSQTPTAASITALTSASNYPTAVSGSNITNMNYVESITWPATQTNGTACANAPNPCGSWDIVGSGSDQGMVASLIPFTLQVTATRAASAGEVTNNSAISPTGASFSLSRTVEVALLPAFEFGIFCDGDCDYFAGPAFNFGGRVHANGNLFLASDSTLTFTDKIAAVGQVITTQLENGWPTSNDYTGTVYVPSAAGACPAAPAAGPATNCVALPAGSWTGGFPPTGAANPAWKGISTTTFNSFIINGLTGATKLQLPFVGSSSVGAIDIIRKPTPGDSTLLANSRLYNEASIRILLADTEADLYPGESRTDASSEDIQLGTPNATPYTDVPAPNTGNSVAAGNMYYATALQGASSNNWTKYAPTGCSTSLTSWPLFGQVTVAGNQCQGAWLRVEYLSKSTNTWTGVTAEWLAYGFGRSYNQPPTHPYNSSTSTAPYCPTYPSFQAVTAGDPLAQCQNPISPAILILQQLQKSKTPANATGSGTANNWLPINFYDAREGEPRDSRPSGDPDSDCSPVGIMNAVELDVGNLWLWLQGSGPYSGGHGLQVNSSNYNGYILYFADHRGMIADKYPLTTFYNGFSGMSGLNDTVNSGSTPGVPDGKLEPITYYATAPTPYSPEDTAVKGAVVNGGNVDNWGEANLGAGFGIAAGYMAEPYYIYGQVTTNAIQCYSTTLGSPTNGTAEWNMVTGPRHALRLVDAGMDKSGNSFLPPTGNTADGNGFTVASEEPVYVWGNYNTGVDDPFWPSENTTTTPHSAAAIIADAVTLLSNPPSGATLPSVDVGWTDIESFEYPAQVNYVSSSSIGRMGNTSYYRMAIAAGKSIPFPETAFSEAVPWKDFGTDGGMHNFLRYLEDRSDNGNGAVVNYAGSMISMYYSQYDTGIFKCCNSTYN
ncbi:MAG: PilX N-terminal domain-containing pilus assembly protein, partial [Candidatus Sulfotelmatobacter sp.]